MNEGDIMSENVRVMRDCVDAKRGRWWEGIDWVSKGEIMDWERVRDWDRKCVSERINERLGSLSKGESMEWKRVSVRD